MGTEKIAAGETPPQQQARLKAELVGQVLGDLVQTLAHTELVLLAQMTPAQRATLRDACESLLRALK